MKLLTSILATELSSIVLLHEEQQVFRRSTMDAIFILWQIAEKALEYYTPAYLCFIDLTKAFDRVKLEDILNIFREKNAPKNIIRIIRDLNTNNTTQFRVGNRLTREIKTYLGIKQGDSLSPMLFNLIMDKIMEAVRVTA